MIEPNLLISILSLTIAIITLFATYQLSYKTQKEKKPFYTLMTRSLIGKVLKDFKQIEIQYNGHHIPRLSESLVAFWNGGKETIYFENVSEKDRIVISPEDGFMILEANLKFQLNDSNNFRVKLENGKAEIEFDYIDYNEGCSIQVIHTGKTSWSLKVSGSIIGAGKISHAKHISYPQRKKKAIWISIGIFSLTTFLSLLYVGLDNIQNVISICSLISILAFAILPMILSINYFIKRKTSRMLGVSDDDTVLRAPNFPPTGKEYERNKDAEPFR